LQAIVDLETAARIDEARAALKRAGVFVSASMFVEIALRELLARRDLPEIMRRHKATARRG
jgi:Arc/MetJ-type ribon-helix-helix transcriptional regulator